MPVLILCGQIEEETPEFLEAERLLLDEYSAKLGLKVDSQIHTLRLKNLVDPSDTDKVRHLNQQLLKAFGLEALDFKAEFLNQGEFAFLAIYVPEGGRRVPMESAAAPAAAKKQRHLPRIRWQIPVGIAGLLILLVILYYGTGLILTNRIDAKYAERDCAALLKLAEPTARFYPPALAPFVRPVAIQAQECDAYVSATKSEESRAWAKALDDYEAYLEEYPKGIYADEAEENAAQMLLNWAKQQHEDKEHSKAIEHLNLLLVKYKGTPSIDDANTLLPECYLEWGKDLKAQEEYLEAEEVLWTFQEWATKNGREKDIQSANLELAWLYLDWAKNLFDLKDYEHAVSTYELALKQDPSPELADSPSTKAHANLPEARVAWAEQLVADKEFSAAVEQYQMALSDSKTNAKSTIQDKQAQAHAKWALSLADSEDFWSAFDHIESAEKITSSDKVKEELASTYTQTLEAFSNSSGSQARALMDETAKAVVEKNKTPELPIFGLDPDHIRIFVYGNATGFSGTGGVSEKFLPQTPGEMRYVAYVTGKSRLVQTCQYHFISSGAYSGSIKRYRSYWVISLYDILSGKIVKTKELAGPSPSGCPSTTYSLNDIYGGSPKISEVETWLSTLIK